MVCTVSLYNKKPLALIFRNIFVYPEVIDGIPTGALYCKLILCPVCKSQGDCLKDETSVEFEPEIGEDCEEDDEDELDSKPASGLPPVRRLRLRGDWSDTGPDARPERDVGRTTGTNYLLQSYSLGYITLCCKSADLM